MNDLTITNTPDRVAFRQKILALEKQMQDAIAGGAPSALDDCSLIHHFTPKDEKYGCVNYGRQIFVPKGTLAIGKIHKHAHLNFVMKGKALVATESGVERLEAPYVFVSEPGTKRAVLAEDDLIWVTSHLVGHGREADLLEIEHEVIAKDYAELGLIDSVNDLFRLEG